MNGRPIYFVNGNHYRMIFVQKNGDYRIASEIGGYGKLLHNFSEYIRKIKENGWEEVDLGTFLKVKYKR